jgi:hypothetical protein
MVQISGSVGVGGQNRREDVLVVQALINNKLPFPLKPLDVDGTCGDLTKFAITKVQRRNLAHPVCEFFSVSRSTAILER